MCLRLLMSQELELEKTLTLHSNSTCSSPIGNRTSDGQIKPNNLTNGGHRFYFDLGGDCSKNYLSYFLDTEKPHDPFIYLNTESPGTSANPELVVSGSLSEGYYKNLC